MASLPTTAAPQPASAPSFTKLSAIYLKALFLMMAPHTFFIVCTGIFLQVTSSATHIWHLASFLGFMEGASGAWLLLGLCSAQRHHGGKLIQVGRAMLLVSFMAQITLGLTLLSNPISPSAMVPFGVACCGALYILDYAYVMAVTEAAGQEATGVAHVSRDSGWLADPTRSVATLFSGAREQPPTSASHETSGLQVGDQGNSKRWFSHKIQCQQSIPASPNEEKEPLLSNLDFASDVV